MHNKFSPEFTFRDLLIVIAGLFVMALGSALVYTADIGTGSIGTLVDGLHDLLGITHGVADMLICVVLLIPMAFLARDLIGIGTLLSLFGVGLSIDFWKGIIAQLPLGNDWVTRIILSVLGLIIGNLGASIYITVGEGISSFDAVVFLFYRFTKLSYAKASIAANYAMLILGFFMGGTVGLGTLVTIVVGGYVSQFFLSRVWKYIGKPSPLKKHGEDTAEPDAQAQ